jgi:hypothetical protein
MVRLFVKRLQFLSSLDKYSQSNSLKFLHADLLKDLLVICHKKATSSIVHHLQIVFKIISMINRKRFEMVRGAGNTNFNLTQVYTKITPNMKTQMKRLFEQKDNPPATSQSPLHQSHLHSSPQKYFLVSKFDLERPGFRSEEVQSRLQLDCQHGPQTEEVGAFLDHDAHDDRPDPRRGAGRERGLRKS